MHVFECSNNNTVKRSSTWGVDITYRPLSAGISTVTHAHPPAARMSVEVPDLALRSIIHFLPVYMVEDALGAIGPVTFGGCKNATGNWGN